MTGAPLAAVDCGTNTIKLLVTGPDGEQAREMRMVRLGQDVDRTGRLADAALERAASALEEYAAIMRDHGVERLRFCATSATRDAANADVFAALVRERLGVDPEVLPGAEEAALAFAGAVRGLGDRIDPTAGPVLVVDVGGGSTELVLGDGSVPTAAVSMDVGSVRLHERHVAHDPPSAAELAAVRADVDAALDAAGDEHGVDPAVAVTVVGVAGTVTTVAAGVLGLPAYDRAALDGVRLAVADVREHVERLVAMTVDGRRALPWMHPGRADVIAAGAVLLVRVLERARAEQLLVSEHDILDGIAWSMA
ncbi:exopolyphosphatase [Nocardioides marinquilinus]|uniref:Ppx/GppA phosphatase family protein n=1 Tax=Nocardioides marinquilinus TaxID=1210400 RepID=UPI0031EFE39B